MLLLLFFIFNYYHFWCYFLLLNYSSKRNSKYQQIADSSIASFNANYEANKARNKNFCMH